jgi:uncharacterized protein (DUF2236 family)
MNRAGSDATSTPIPGVTAKAPAHDNRAIAGVAQCQPSAPPRGGATAAIEPGRPVTEADLERELTLAATPAADGAAGIFGPGSMAWRIDREAVLFLAAGRALLMQLAHPWVAAAIAHHSRSLGDPIGRFHRTFGSVFTIVFGTSDAAFAAARALYRRHAAISGTLTQRVGAFAAGSAYCANDVAALRWVFATLVDGALAGYRLVGPALSDAERENYYRDMRLFAALFGIPQAALPPDYSALSAYIEAMLASDTIAVGAEARAITAALFAGAGTRLRVPLWYRGLTARLLPARLRCDFGLDGERTAARALTALRLVYPRLPLRLRYVGPYQEACARLAGRKPDAATRLLNRFWIGRDSMAG